MPEILASPAAGVGLLLFAALLLTVGAELFVEHLAAAASWLRLPMATAALLLAGAEPEELITAALASAEERPGLAIGDALGANLTMLTLALGLVAVFAPLPSSQRIRRYAATAAGAGGLAWLTLVDGQVSRVEGAALVTAYVGIVAALWFRERTPPALGELSELDDNEADAMASASTTVGVRHFALAVTGLAVMGVGGFFAVRGSVAVAEGFGWSDTSVGLTVLALATTAEIFALVWAAARRGIAEVAIAGVLGAVLYNATATVGVAALVTPLTVPGVGWPAAAAALLPLVFVLAGRTRTQVIGRRAGALLVGAYVAYVALVAARLG